MSDILDVCKTCGKKIPSGEGRYLLDGGGVECLPCHDKKKKKY